LFPAEVTGSRGNNRRHLCKRLYEIGRYVLPLAFRNMWVEPVITKRYPIGSLLLFIHPILRYADRISESMRGIPFEYVCGIMLGTNSGRTVV
jgi:hypothetical protein